MDTQPSVGAQNYFSAVLQFYLLSITISFFHKNFDATILPTKIHGSDCFDTIIIERLQNNKINTQKHFFTLNRILCGRAAWL